MSLTHKQRGYVLPVDPDARGAVTVISVVQHYTNLIRGSEWHVVDHSSHGHLGIFVTKSPGSKCIPGNPIMVYYTQGDEATVYKTILC